MAEYLTTDPICVGVMSLRCSVEVKGVWLRIICSLYLKPLVVPLAYTAWASPFLHTLFLIDCCDLRLGFLGKLNKGQLG